MLGGYFMVDCTGLDLLTQTEQTIDGIFSQVDNSYKSGKPVFAYNCKWGDDITMSPVPVMVNPDPDTDGNYVATASVLQLRITPDDGVTVAVLS